MTRLPPPDVSRTDEALRSNAFGDIYYQEADGLAETRHVFLDGNDLSARFAAVIPPWPFVIGELGFGTGLNFLAATELFERIAPPGARLDYWSVEGFPFTPDQLTDILAAITRRWPELESAAAALGAAYPLPRPGFARVHVTDRVSLTLAFGEVKDIFARADFKANAWFLDGFSPAQNPAMWAPEIMAAVGKHTKAGGTFATFTVAGDVRRGLAAAGFEIAKRQGFGRKREMLTGRSPETSTDDPAAPVRRLAIIGAGIAGAAAADAARRAGLDVTVFDPAGPAAGASGNPAGLLMPRVEAVDNAAARFYRDAYLYALRFYAARTPEALLPCGGLAHGDEGRFGKVIDTGLWHETDIALEGEALNAAQGSVLIPGEAVRTLIKDIDIRSDRVTALRPSPPGGIEVVTESGTHPADAVIVAAGPASAALLGIEEDMSASRGQVDVFAGPVIERIVTDGTYIAPLGEKLVAGATYDPAAPDVSVLPDDQSTARNRDAAEALLGTPPGAPIGHRASLRATTRDRHPIAGMVTASLYAMTGLGSRGLVTAPLIAEQLIALMTNGVPPLEKGAADLVVPSRFAERRRRRGQS